LISSWGLDEEPYVDNAEKSLIEIPYLIMRYIDVIIARIANTLDTDTNIIIISDHGHKPEKVSYYVNDIFIESNLYYKPKFRKGNSEKNI